MHVMTCRQNLKMLCLSSTTESPLSLPCSSSIVRCAVNKRKLIFPLLIVTRNQSARLRYRLVRANKRDD